MYSVNDDETLTPQLRLQLAQNDIIHGYMYNELIASIYLYIYIYIN